MDIDTMYNELINQSQAVSILAENALQTYPESDLAGQLAQSTLELVDRLDELHAWVSGGGPLPGQIQEVQQLAMASIHISNALDYLIHKESAFSHSFSPEFYGDVYTWTSPGRQPTNVADALMNFWETDKEGFSAMVKELFPGYAKYVDEYLPESLVADIMDKIRETDTVGTLTPPVDVWIDPEGYYRIDVYDEPREQELDLD